MHYLADICLAQKLGAFACTPADKVCVVVGGGASGGGSRARPEWDLRSARHRPLPAHTRVQVALRGFRKRALRYACCAELVFDEFLVAGGWMAADAR